MYKEYISFYKKKANEKRVTFLDMAIRSIILKKPLEINIKKNDYIVTHAKIKNVKYIASRNIHHIKSTWESEIYMPRIDGQETNNYLLRGDYRKLTLMIADYHFMQESNDLTEYFRFYNKYPNFIFQSSVKNIEIPEKLINKISNLSLYPRRGTRMLPDADRKILYEFLLDNLTESYKEKYLNESEYFPKEFPVQERLNIYKKIIEIFDTKLKQR